MYPGAYVNTTPDKPAVIEASTGRVTTFKELDGRSADLAAALHALGLRKGDVIAFVSDNRSEAYEIYWAAVRSGLYVVPVNRHLVADEVAYIVRDSGARVVFASAGLKDLAEKLVPLIPNVTARYVFGGQAEGYLPYLDLLAQAGPRLEDQPRGSDMPYSSGTTGRPKGIKPSLPPIQVDQPGDPITGILANLFKVDASAVYLSPAPVYHTAPLKWGTAVQALGGTVVILDRFDAETFLAAIEKYGVTITQVVPTMFVRLLQLPEDARAAYDVSSLRLAVHAAAPCAPEVKRAMIEWWGPTLFEYYGASEQHGMSMISAPEWLEKPGSVGKHGLGVAHIIGEDGQELPAGEIGLIYFERETVPFEYHNDPEKTAQSQLPGAPNWTTVGDIGYIDADGYLFITGRKAFTIISGGVNIYPQEIEDILTLHPAIYDVGVIGVPDAEFGQSVKAVVQLREGVEPSADLAQEIIDYVRERIAHFKAPRTVDFVDDLPRTPTGKLVKRKIEERYAEPAGAAR